MNRAPLSLFVAALAIIFTAAALLIPVPDETPSGTVRVVARLDEYTRKSNPQIENTLPAFLLLRGALGVLPAEPVPPPDAPVPEVPPEPKIYRTSDVTGIDEAELQKGFCTATLPRLVRQQFPGSYDALSDEELEKTLLETRPEYKDKLCVFPIWISTDPHDIVKYEVVPDRPRRIGRMRVIRAGLITALTGVVGFVALRRFLIPNS